MSIAVLVVLWTMGMSNAGEVRVKMWDECDPATFNANPPVGPGAGVICDKDFDGGVTFAEFLSFLSPAAFGHPAWRFDASYLEIKPRQTVHVKNKGGEDHTFTEVSKFDGGRIEGINTALGLQALPECAEDVAPIIRPGDSIELEDLSEGTHLFLCCIHPWMHAIIEVKPRHHRHHRHE
jgi:plastocyanin